MRFVLASHNKKKLDELSAILGGLGMALGSTGNAVLCAAQRAAMED